MSFLDRFLAQKRLKQARQSLAVDPSVANYIALGSELARNEDLDAALKVCEEGSVLLPDSTELRHLTSRVRQLSIGGRTRELTKELRESPRPALYREMCELQLSAGRFDRAEEFATEWYAFDRDALALFLRARARAERFFVDRGREDGRAAWELLGQCEGKLIEREPHIRLKLELATCVGAWGDAQRCLASLLKQRPGDPELEESYRAVSLNAEGAPDFEAGLRSVEKSGLFSNEAADEDEDEGPPLSSTAIRPVLEELAQESTVKAALFTKGSTCLVRGLSGATAERMSRAVGEVVQQSRLTARRLGLGQALEIQVEGTFGSLLVVPGEQGSSAIWRDGPVKDAHRRKMSGMFGSATPASTRSDS